jgi:hypothetical protein
MSRHALADARLERGSWRWTTLADRPTITWWPTSLPGSDLDETPRRRTRRATRPRIRRGRIQFVAA